jgi:hypothetical protein
MKDFVSVQNSKGAREHKQKQLVLSNLNELYEKFESHIDANIVFSKFCELCPKWCVLAEAPDTHFVCLLHAPEC